MANFIKGNTYRTPTAQDVLCGAYKGVGKTWMHCDLQDYGHWYRQEELGAVKVSQVWTEVYHYYYQM